MNLLKAKELESGGWHYTTFNDNRGRTHTHVCCIAHQSTPHATREEAERCKYEYDISGAAYHANPNGKQARACAECGEWTTGFYLIDGMQSVELCPAHADSETLRKHYPFEPGMESWES